MHKDSLKSSASFSAKNLALAQKLGPREIFEGPKVWFLGPSYTLTRVLHITTADGTSVID